MNESRIRHFLSVKRWFAGDFERSAKSGELPSPTTIFFAPITEMAVFLS